MTGSLRAWLDGRSPRPPADLRARILHAVEEAGRTEEETPAEAVTRKVGNGEIAAGRGDEGEEPAEATVEALFGAARRALGSAVSRTGRVRETAFDLLVADALVTYACEAALETDAPEKTLASVLAVGDEGPT